MDEPRALGWSDLDLLSITWEEGGRDLHLTFAQPQKPELRRLRAGWAHGLRIDLKLPEGTGGTPLTWDVEFVPHGDRAWEVRIDFASAGEISFLCTHLSAEDG